MQALVRIALARPYTFVVLALLILIVGPLAYFRTPTDIFPEIRIPVVAAVWQYSGLSPDQMEGRITSQFERSLSTTVNDVEHIESSSLVGAGIVKIFFHPHVNIAVANAQVTAIAQTMIKWLPPGATPPLILNYSAATVPVIQLALSGHGFSEQNLADLAMNTVRTQLVTVPGVAVPYPFGGKSRQIMVDIDNTKLRARGLSPQDIADALTAQNMITPVGTQKIGSTEYTVKVNNFARGFEELNNLPIKSVNGTNIYIRDVAFVHDGNAVQTNIVHVNDSRSVLLTVFKNGANSTLAIVDGVKARVRQLKDLVPEGLKIDLVGDQSIFVRSAVNGVLYEGIVAAALTSLMILLFLGSLRSTVIIAVSIPLSVLGAIAILSALGETLNIMTLGGLALAVGLLVDEATVTIENINWHLEQGKDVRTAILDGAQQIVIPAFVSLLSICIVFIPMFFLEGVSRFLFVPMAEAVMLSMTCSFLLSRTLVPTMANYLLKPHAAHTDLHGTDAALPPSRNPLVRFQRRFEAGFERFRESYRDVLAVALHRRRIFVPAFLGFVALSFLLTPFLGRNFFPSVDSGQMLLHVRVPVGTRIEETSQQFARIAQAIRRIIPAEELTAITDNIGLPVSSINSTYNNSGTIGPQDGDIQIALTKDHRPTDEYVARLREVLPEQFPGTTFAFLPADIVSQILNFGAPAPIDVQIRGPRLDASYAYARELLRRIRAVPGVADARIQQSQRYPVMNVEMDRSRAEQVGVTARDVTNSMLLSLVGSGQITPTYWLNPANGVSYPIVAQAPQYRLGALADLAAMPVTSETGNTQILGGVASVSRSMTDAAISHRDIMPVVDIFATPQNRDLGAVATDLRKIVADAAGTAPKATTVTLRGQVATMDTAFSGLGFGLLGAIVLIYFLIVVNFQSWTDPFIIITALPAALAGIVWMLFATHTTLSVPALTGAIMAMGVSTANSILVISFARERLAAGCSAAQAALEAGFTRIRPVLMTALAMVIGMTPMALGLGEGGEQNAPLGRAVIGGLVFATVATLVFVPVVFAIIHGRRPSASSTAPAGEPHVAH